MNNTKNPQMYMIQDKTDGIRAGICSVGAALVFLEVPLADGSKRDVVLGYENLQEYYQNGPHLGATVAPFANRIGGAEFSLNGQTYRLEKNDGNNCLHGGFRFLQDQEWNVTKVSENSITFSADSEDGEHGFPGPLHVEVTYTVEGRALLLDYHGNAADAEQDVVFNPTNHSYFNLNGQGNGDVLNHRLTIYASQITPFGPKGVPDGTILDVADTPFDFGAQHIIGERIEEQDPILQNVCGYDHNYILMKNEKLHAPQFDAAGREVHLAACLTDEEEALTMEVYTDLPGLQLYTANHLNVSKTGKSGQSYSPRSAVCLETQYFPNAVNVPEFPQPVICAGQEMYSRTIYRFV